MKKELYLLTFEMFDGEDDYKCTDIFDGEIDAKEYLQELIENYRPFWEDFDVIENAADYFCAYNSGFYDNAHIEIIIEEKSVQ